MRFMCLKFMEMCEKTSSNEKWISKNENIKSFGGCIIVDGLLSFTVNIIQNDTPVAGHSLQLVIQTLY